MSSAKEYDCIVIGAGAAGLTAALYAVRRTLKTVIITKDFGGQASLAGTVENYPGVDKAKGIKIMELFKKQAEDHGAKIIYKEVEAIEKGEEQFVVKTRDEEFIGKTIILAFGLTPKDLGVPGENELKNKGVSYCVTCDGPLFKNKTVAVVGGGNSALDAAELLTKIAKKVYMIHRKDSFSGENIVADQLMKRDNIEVLLNTEVTEIQGNDKVESIKTKNNQSSKESIVKCDGVFVEVGYIAKTDIVKDLVECNERKQIKIGRDCETSCPGVFAAGDVTDITYKQIVISAGEGAKAALQAYKFLQQKSGNHVGVDWGKST
ncbi:thioredoxin-disulfide reductase [Patescibacteria group bacterium]|nr:thioredoxin-disulfide reductase [Patescibacteria group bacterium]MBU1074971.1 thioredoxin-disulfide reductase [Patescibacteria group bacterium]